MNTSGRNAFGKNAFSGNGLSRRRFLVGGGALLGAGALGTTGCGPGTGGESGTIQFTWWGNDERDRRTNAAIQTYQKEFGVTIRANIVNWDDYWDALATKVAGGSPPDLIQMDYAFITEYASRGNLLALDDYVPDKLHIDDFDERSLASGTVDGKLYGADMGINSVGMLYNETLIQGAGLEMPGDDMTWTEFANFAAKLATATPENVFGTPNGMLNDVPFECWLRQRGKALYTNDGQLGFEPADMEEWFTFWKDLEKSGVIPPPELELEGTGEVSDALIVQSRAGFAFNWSNQLPAFNTASDDVLRIHMYPQGDDPDAEPGQYYKASMLLSVAAESQYTDQSVTIMDRFLTNPKYAGQLGFERGVPPSKSVREQLLDDASADDKATAAYIEDIDGRIGETPPPPPAGVTKAEEAFTFSVEEAAYGRLSIEDAVDKYFTAATEALGG